MAAYTPLAVELTYTKALIIVAALSILVKVLQGLYVSSRKNARLPPGPRGPPIIGMTREMLDGSMLPWYRFEAWSKQYDARKLHVLRYGRLA
jgi:hypothetical protein